MSKKRELIVKPTEVVDPEAKPDIIKALFLKHRFDPLEELIALYKSGVTTVLDKDGSPIEVPIEVSDRVAILKELNSYKYSKVKPSLGLDKINPVFNIVINKI